MSESCESETGVESVSHQGSLGESVRKRKERERKEWRSSLGREGEKCDGLEKGGDGAREDIMRTQQ